MTNNLFKVSCKSYFIKQNIKALLLKEIKTQKTFGVYWVGRTEVKF